MPELPITFVATATDNCAVAQVSIDGYDCSRSDGTGQFCEAEIEADTITVTGIVQGGSQITWAPTATDESGNVADMTCNVDVAALASAPPPQVDTPTGSGSGAIGVIELLLGLVLVYVRQRRLNDATRGR